MFLQALVSDRNQLAEQLAQAQAQPGGSGGASPPGGVALQLVQVLKQQVGNLEGRLASQEKQRKAMKKV